MGQNSLSKDIEKYIWGSVWMVVSKYPQLSEFYSPDDLFQEGVLLWLIVEKKPNVKNKFSYWSTSYRNRILELLRRVSPLVSYDASYNAGDGEDNSNWEESLCSYHLDEEKRKLLNLIVRNTTKEERMDILTGKRWTIRRVRKRLGLPEVFEDEYPRKRIYSIKVE